MARWDLPFDAIHCPATFWLGEQDGSRNLEGGQWLLERVPHASLRVLPDYGHLVAFERWDDVLDSLVQ